ncbi:LysR family transcriptional regulator [Streptomyces pristinaespiralis]|uniref:LysR family transcriptional regulator n=1 Tax=Streptomyces pristinaespiralis TaxID=38300 RepID=UPI0037A19AF3
MELRQLAYFVAVAEERNFTRAAARLHISQSGVSAQIRRLESEVGAELFDRTARSVTLTPAGEAALGHARAALAAAGAVGRSVGELTGLIRGRLTVGMVAGCTVTPFFDGLAAFHRAHPGVELRLLEDNSDRLIEAVRTGGVDLALVGTAALELEGLDTWTVISERLVVAVPHGHALARCRRVTLREAAAHPLVCMPPGTGLRTVLDGVCAEQGIEPRIALQAGAAEAVAALARRGLGVAVLSESMAAACQDGLTVRLIDDVRAPALLALVRRRTGDPAVRALSAHCRGAFTGAAGPVAVDAPVTPGGP